VLLSELSNDVLKQLKAYFPVYCEVHNYFKVRSYIRGFLITHLGYTPNTKEYNDVKAILKNGLSNFVADLRDKGVLELFSNKTYRIIKNY